MHLYSKKTTPNEQFSGTLGPEPLDLPSSSRCKENNLQSPQSFRIRNSYVNKQEQLLSTGRTNIHQQPLTTSRRLAGVQRSPLSKNPSRSPLREIIYIQKSSVSPIRKRVVEVHGDVSQQTMRLIDQKFLSFEDQMKKRFAALEERAGRLTDRAIRIDSNKQ